MLNSINSFLQLLLQKQICERQGSLSITAEPVNIITNLAFFISAYLLYKYLFNNKLHLTRFVIFPIILTFVGIGSTLMHIFNTPLTLFLDLLPIFILSVLFVYTFVSYLSLKPIALWLISAGFAIFALVITILYPYDLLTLPVQHSLAISVQLLLLIITATRFSKKVTKRLAVILVISTLAILLNNLDTSICPAFPIGTHFTWHLTMALVAFLSVKFLTQLPNARSLFGTASTKNNS